MATPDPVIELSRSTRPRPRPRPSAASRHSSSRLAHHAAEPHASAATSNAIRDAIIGFADGLTVPFALTAGLSALGSSKLVLVGGLAELCSGALSMGLGAYLAASTERARYASEESRERREVATKADAEREECVEILEQYGIGREAANAVVTDLCRDEEAWIRFMMDFELKMEKPGGSAAWISAATMGLSYFIGGLIPMIPYFAMPNVTHALFVSIGITFVVLLAFGFVKNYITVGTVRSGLAGAAQTLFIGALAAGTAYGIVRGINSSNLGS